MLESIHFSPEVLFLLSYHHSGKNMTKYLHKSGYLEGSITATSMSQASVAFFNSARQSARARLFKRRVSGLENYMDAA